MNVLVDSFALLWKMHQLSNLKRVEVEEPLPREVVIAFKLPDDVFRDLLELT